MLISETKRFILGINVKGRNGGTTEDHALIFLAPSLEAEIGKLSKLVDEHSLYSVSSWDNDQAFCMGDLEKEEAVDTVLMVVTDACVYWTGNLGDTEWETDPIYYAEFHLCEPGKVCDLRNADAYDEN